MVLIYVPFRRDIPTVSAPESRVLHAWAEANQVPILDVTAAISPHPVSEICLYDGTHFNATGNQIVGQTILDHWSEFGQP